MQQVTKDVFSIKKDMIHLDDEIDQIWAAAYQLYKDDEVLYLTAEEEQEAREIQDNHSEESAKSGLVEEYLNIPITDDWYNKSLNDRRNYVQGGEFGEVPKGDIKRDKICVMEIWCELFNGDPKQLTPMASREINEILKGLKGWKQAGHTRFGKVYGTQRAYRREK